MSLLGKNYKSSIAFTLAEVLITLLIIGVVSSIVIPALINDTQNQEFYTLLKKDYSTLSDATKRMMIDNGGTLVNYFSDQNDIISKYENYVIFTKKCPAGTQGCFYAGTSAWKNLHGDDGWFDFTSYPTAIMNNGSLFRVILSRSDCEQNNGTGVSTGSPAEHTCGMIDVDVNGFKRPNVLGRDIFRFWITKTGIYPTGISNDAYSNWNTYCNINNSHQYSGRSCAAKVLTGGTVD